MAAIIPMEIGGDRWNANVYASLAVASELVAEFDRPADQSAGAVDEEEVHPFLLRLNAFLARYLSLTDSLQEAPIGIPKEKLIAARDSVLDLYRICKRILSRSEQISQLGRMKSELDLLHSQCERLLDVVDWLDALSTPEEIEAIFKAAEMEREAGEFVSWSEVK